jgi:hypothetical protein
VHVKAWTIIIAEIPGLFLLNNRCFIPRNEAVYLDAADETFNTGILRRQRPGDQLVVLYSVGGGGGHSLHISDLSIAVAHSTEAAVAIKGST